MVSGLERRGTINNYRTLEGRGSRGQGTSMLVRVLKFSRSKDMEGGEHDEGVRWETSKWRRGLQMEELCGTEPL